MSKRGGYPGGGFGGMNMQQMMQQAQKMQQDIAAAQNALKEQEVTAVSGGGAVSVTVTGEKQLKAVTISPEAVDPDDVEMLQDLIIAAVNDAMRQVDELSSQIMNRATGGVDLGGLL